MNKRGVNENKREYLSPFYISDKLLQWCVVKLTRIQSSVWREKNGLFVRPNNWLGFSGKYQILCDYDPFECIESVFIEHLSIHIFINAHSHKHTQCWSPWYHWLDNKFTKYYLLNDFFSFIRNYTNHPTKTVFQMMYAHRNISQMLNTFTVVEMCVCIYSNERQWL